MLLKLIQTVWSLSVGGSEEKRPPLSPLCPDGVVWSSQTTARYPPSALGPALRGGWDPACGWPPVASRCQPGPLGRAALSEGPQHQRRHPLPRAARATRYDELQDQLLGSFFSLTQVRDLFNLSKARLKLH